MKKSTTTRSYFSNIFIIALAFVAGAMIYFLGAIGFDKIAPYAGAANGSHQQVTVLVGTCNCITEFKPNPMLPGSGNQSDPYISNNMHVNMAFKANGIGKITIEDENGNILYEYNQTVIDGQERIIPIVFPNAGNHKIVIKFNGDEVSSNGVHTELFFRISRLIPIIPDLEIPGVPNTGAYIYIAGYAVQTYSLIISGAVVAIVAGILLFFYRRRQRRDVTKVKSFVKKTTPRRNVSKKINSKKLRK